MRTYEIIGTPIAWKRSGQNGKRHYDPQIKEKETLQKIIRIGNKGLHTVSNGLLVIYEFHMPIPKSWSNTRRLKAIGQPHVFTPDTDNLVKFVNDALNKVAWNDDAQIHEVYAKKFYSEIPRTVITIIEKDSNEKKELNIAEKMIRQVGSKFEWTYSDCKEDTQGWNKVRDYRPFPFDMTVVKVRRQGELLNSEIPAWWTGEGWMGRKLENNDQIVFWKLSPKGN
jgi:Holliday junction resolvase RusA-like endonuclease